MEPTQANQALHILERMIVFDELDSHRMYSEKEIAALLGIGRTPVREALQRLAYNKIAFIHPRRGVMFPKVTVEQQLKMLEVRRGLEPQCAKFAAMRGSLEEKQRMLLLADAFLEAGEKNEERVVLECLRESHELLVEAAHNEYFPLTMGPVQSLSRRFWFINKKSVDNQIGAERHAEIMQNVGRGNADQAMVASVRLLDYLADFAFGTLKS